MSLLVLIYSVRRTITKAVLLPLKMPHVPQLGKICIQNGTKRCNHPCCCQDSVPSGSSSFIPSSPDNRGLNSREKTKDALFHFFIFRHINISQLYMCVCVCVGWEVDTTTSFSIL